MNTQIKPEPLTEEQKKEIVSAAFPPTDATRQPETPRTDEIKRTKAISTAYYGRKLSTYAAYNEAMTLAAELEREAIATTRELSALRDEAAQLREEVAEAKANYEAVSELYMELIMEVGDKHDNETRHETALRYIKQAERPLGESEEIASGEWESGREV